MPITSTKTCHATTPSSSRLTSRARRARSRSPKATYGGGGSGVVSPHHHPRLHPNRPANRASRPARTRASTSVSTSMIPRLLLRRAVGRPANLTHDTPRSTRAHPCRRLRSRRRLHWKYRERLQPASPLPPTRLAQPHPSWHIFCGLLFGGLARRLMPRPAGHASVTLVRRRISLCP